MAVQTRFGISGWGTRRAGSFAGKVEASITDATGSVFVSVERMGPDGRAVRRYIVSWVASDNGDTVVEFGSSSAPFFVGQIYRVVTEPGAMVAPTDNYDIVLKNAIGVDVLNGALANRDTANSEQVWIKDVWTNAHSQPVSTHCRYRLKITNAGAAGSGVCVIYTREG